MKITQENRSTYFLVGTMLVGLLCIGVLMLFENTGGVGDVISKIEVKSTYKQLEMDVNDVKNKNFDPNSFNTMVMSINQNYSQGLITSAAKNNLTKDLTDIFSTQIFSQSERLLNGNEQNTSEKVLSWLSQLEIIMSKNAKIDNYRSQIKLFEYYSITLPERVNNFVAGGPTQFDENTYLNLKNQVSTMPNFEASYQNRQKFVAIKNELLPTLINAYNQWIQQ